MANQFQAIEREIVARIDALKGPEASKALAEFAARRRDEVIAKDAPSAPTVATYVDGIRGGSLEQVKPDGVIRFEFSRLELVAAFIWQTLLQISPFRTKRDSANPPTHYRDEHAIFIDGGEVDALPERIPAGAVLVFVNTQPYSRKIERGLSVKASNGVYEQVARLARARFRQQASIEFTYRELPGQGPAGPAARSANPKRRAMDDRFPAIALSQVAALQQ